MFKRGNERRYIDKGYYLYNSKKRAYFRNTEAKIGILITSGQSLDTCKHLYTHELGHALGYNGHAPGTSDVMYKNTSSYKTLTNSEKNHLKQVY